MERQRVRLGRGFDGRFGGIIMLKIIYLVFGMAVLAAYASAAWFGWELANSGSRSRLGVPFIYTGYRGGK